MTIHQSQPISHWLPDPTGYKTVRVATNLPIASPPSSEPQRKTPDSASPRQEKSSLHHHSHAFIDQLSAIVNIHLDDSEFTVERLAKESNMSRTQLYRRLKAIDHTTATLFIRNIRLARAVELLEGGLTNVTQVAYSVGFCHMSYFARVFHERYGVLPSQYGKLTI